jgi:hypothetical protein
VDIVNFIRDKDVGIFDRAKRLGKKSPHTAYERIDIALAGDRGSPWTPTIASTEPPSPFSYRSSAVGLGRVGWSCCICNHTVYYGRFTIASLPQNERKLAYTIFEYSNSDIRDKS